MNIHDPEVPVTLRRIATRVLFASLIVYGACTGTSQTATRQSPYKFSHEIAQQLDADTLPWKHQIAAFEYSLIGNYHQSLLSWEHDMRASNRAYPEDEALVIKQKYDIVDAKQYILEKARDHQVVIINEAHHVPRHRTFTTSLLENLYQQGYTNLGLEALGYFDSTFVETGYPTPSTGYYLVEPQFGNLFREALRIGYHIFPYETTKDGHDSRDREKEQARNIKQMIDSRPGGKFLIHCGFDHAMEGDHGSWGKAMAGRLTEYTGIDPLTINQVMLTPKSQPEFNHELLKLFDPEQSAILVDQEGNPYPYTRGNAWSDIAVMHPNTKLQSGRPNWMFLSGRIASRFQLRDDDLDFPVMLLAHVDGEPIEEATPYDIVELQSASDEAIFALPPGQYNIVIRSSTGQIQQTPFKVTTPN